MNVLRVARCVGILLAGGCGSGEPSSAVPAPPSAVVARVDTVAGRLDSASHAMLRRGEGGDAPSVLLALRGSDVGTCEDLGRQARELQRWASGRDLRLVVWVEDDSTAVLQTFLRRERIRPGSVIRSAPLPRLRDHGALTTPAALLVQPDGTVRGTTHPERQPNVRVRSFADELEALPAADSSRRP